MSSDQSVTLADSLRDLVLGLDHTALAVPSIRIASRLYVDLLGGQPVEAADEAARGFRWLSLRYANANMLELLEPVGSAGFLSRFLERRGPGLHHITYLVADVREAVALLREAAVRVVDEAYEDPHWLEAFIPPKAAYGTIVQLAQTDLGPSDRAEHWPAHAFLLNSA